MARTGHRAAGRPRGTSRDPGPGNRQGVDPATRAGVFLERAAAKVTEALENMLSTPGAVPPQLHQAMRYAVFPGGKRLRPAMLLAVADMLAVPRAGAMPAACALELVHSYSLIHDDLPAMDNDDLRRGRPTVHRVFGEAIALLAGDALLTMAFQVLAGGGPGLGLPMPFLAPDEPRPLAVGEATAARPSLGTADDRRVRAAATVEAVQILAAAAGAGGMVGGQALEWVAPRPIGKEVMVDIHRRKTGGLFHAACLIPAALAGATPNERLALSLYADGVGLAYQVVDDLLDEAGAAPGSSFPSVFGRESSRAMACEATASAVRALERFGEKGAVLAGFTELLLHRRR